MLKFLTPLLLLTLILGTGAVLAQETSITDDVAEAINLDEEIQPEDLGVGDPQILPDSPIYFLKNWGRGIQSILAFDPVKKAELKLKFASEKLIEAKKLIKMKKDSKTIDRGIENYQKEIGKIKLAADKIKEKTKDSPEVNNFLDKFTRQQLLHYRILEKLETQVPQEAFAKIKETRERHLEKFAEVMTKLEDRKEEIGTRLEKRMAEIKGSEFREFKNLEMLEKLEEKMPESVKGTIRAARENSLRRLKTNVAEMPSEKLERFKAYAEKASGTKEKQVKILEDLRETLKEKPAVREKLLEARDKVLEKTERWTEKGNCPSLTPPAPGFCRNGRVITEKDAKTDCPLPPKCLR